MRVQFDVEGVLWERFLHYIVTPKMRHFVARQALEEWINRREGRDKKLQAEQLLAGKRMLKPIIQQMLDAGELHVD